MDYKNILTLLKFWLMVHLKIIRNANFEMSLGKIWIYFAVFMLFHKKIFKELFCTMYSINIWKQNSINWKIKEKSKLLIISFNYLLLAFLFPDIFHIFFFILLFKKTLLKKLCIHFLILVFLCVSVCIYLLTLSFHV